MTAFILSIIVVALVFDYINGFHDAANSIATIVSTRVLSPRAAVVWAAAFNFIAFVLFEPTVARNIAKGVDPSVVTPNVLLAALLGAIIWNLATWYWGLPSSSSHALLGGFAGAAVANARNISVLDSAFFGKTAAFIVLSPLIGAALGYFLMHFIRLVARGWTPYKVDKNFRRMQLLSAAAYSIGHGGNDAQKTMGIITALLVSAGLQEGGAKMKPHLWVVLLCHAAMGLGTLSGGWRIVKTMGMKITKLRPVGGFSAETAGAIALFGATTMGIPVSTTHTITGSIVGVGATSGRLSAVRWGVAGRIVWAWILTIPAAAILAAVTYGVARVVSGVP
jgi:inorganic phosphate transporter, PiT family